jgi:hypothetical protein
MTLEAFELQVTSACAESPIVVGVSVVASGVTWLNLRAHLTDGTFADAFYNESTGKTSFALIKEGRRIFGADNRGGWHWHPFGAPETHVSGSTTVTFKEFLSRIEERLKA